AREEQQHSAAFTILLRLFFFSSRRRHTRSKRDWSSDVCSSDLSQFMIRLFFEFYNFPIPMVDISIASFISIWFSTDKNNIITIKIGRASCRERVQVSMGIESVQQKTGYSKIRWRMTPRIKS